MTIAESALAALLAAAVVALLVVLRRSSLERARLLTRLEASARELERLQLSFSRFAPDTVVEEIATSGVSMRGERKEITALFADLVGFTALSEKIEPSVLVRILNGYFLRMSDAIATHHGYVSTFIGDGLLALFGALEPNRWQASDAVQAALAMRAGLVDYNRELERDGLPTLGIGIGLHRGTGVAGLVGSRELMQYAFVGRTVNVAARVQGLTREHRVDILITQAVRDSIDGRFRTRDLEHHHIRGIEAPIQLFAVEGFDDTVPPP